MPYCPVPEFLKDSYKTTFKLVTMYRQDLKDAKSYIDAHYDLSDPAYHYNRGKAEILSSILAHIDPEKI